MGETDLTAAAAPVLRGNVVTVNVTALGTALGLTVRASGRDILIADPTGFTYRGTEGSSALQGSARTLSLAFPLQMLGSTVYLPVDVVAALAGKELSLDRAARRATLGIVQKAQAPDATGPEGWEVFAIAKPEALREAEARDRTFEGAVRTPRVQEHRPPPASDSIRFGAGIGYVQGTDFGVELSASGRAHGFDIGAGTLITEGDGGARMLGGRLVVTDSEGGRSLELGDMGSSIWGTRRGARFSWGPDPDRQRSLSLYQAMRGATTAPTALAYRDTLRLSRHLFAGGEVATDGAYLLHSGYQAGRLGLFGYQRGGAAGGNGVSAAIPLWQGASLHAGFSTMEDTEGRSDLLSFALRVPITRQVDVTLDQTETRTAHQHSRVRSLMLGVPLGPARVFTRYQLTDNSLRAVLAGDNPPLRQHARAWTTAMGYAPFPGLTFDYQVNMAWQWRAPASLSESLVTTYQLDPRTDIQLFSGFPDLLDWERFRVRLQHRLDNALSLSLDYGKLSPYQSDTEAAGRGFKVMLARHWDLPTAPGGARIRGQVRDQAGKPIGGALVCWNGYSVITDAQGRYQFESVPAGTHTLSLDPASIPANCRVAEGEQQVQVASRRRYTLDFQVVPLRSLRGTVFCDANGNGQPDPGEGVAGVVLRLNGFATASGPEGDFGFYNIEPGEHVVRVDTERLPEGFAPASAPEARVTLPVDGTAAAVRFLFTRREKPIIFQPLP